MIAKPAFAIVCALGGSLALAMTAGAARAEVQLWGEAGAGLEVMDDLEATAEASVRFDENVTRLAGLVPDIGLEYQPWWSLRVGGGYRLSYERRRRGDLELRHRAEFDTRARHDVGDVRLRHRVRFQSRYRPRDGHTPAVRNRVGVGWRGVEPWVPRITLESWHRLGVEREDGEGGGARAFHFHKWRLEARVRYDFGSRSVYPFYQLEVSRTHADDPPFHIFGLNVFQGF